ncbi:MAG: NAD(+)/NADH kinase [Phycisphaerales bacterium]|nr:NAD(+)/NADH kinase [Phycisphaerales bacterium]
MANPARILLIASPERARTREVLSAVLTTLANTNALVAQCDAEDAACITQVAHDFAIVIGGDGTIIEQARLLLQRATPIIGINAGRVGFLAEFDSESFDKHARFILAGGASVRARTVLAVAAMRGAQRIGGGIAINDCVITAGEPFRMIELALTVDGESGPEVVGDGVIVATPTGSTAYSASAGGAIVHPSLDALSIVPICAQSLAFRPVTIPASARIQFTLRRANLGTALILDGMKSVGLEVGDQISIERNLQGAMFVTNPDNSYWRTLTEKLRWAAMPSYRTDTH